MNTDKFRFVLASSSPRRKELVSHLKIPFEILSTDVLEESFSQDPFVYAQEIASLKAQAALEKVKILNLDQSFVVAADTIVYLEGKFFGKPKDIDEASSFLRELSGKTHSVFTAVEARVLGAQKTNSLSFVEETKVTFSKISNSLMERYLETKDSLDKAGAYGIQGASLSFISKIEGDYANVVGFPLSRFVSECEHFFEPISSSKGLKKELWLNLF